MHEDMFVPILVHIGLAIASTKCWEKKKENKQINGKT